MAAEANLSLLHQHAAVILARLAAQRIVRRQIQREGRVKLSTLSAATIARLSNEYVLAHPELIAEAAQSEIVQNSTLAHRKRSPANQRLLVCESHERKSASKGDLSKVIGALP
jgi:hypothetical protein